jgi:hypothetical protein
MSPNMLRTSFAAVVCVSALVACGFEQEPSKNVPRFPTGGSSSVTPTAGSSTTTAGTFGTAGDTAAGGTFGTAGTGFGMSGSDTGGAGGAGGPGGAGGAGGSGTAGTATAGTGGSGEPAVCPAPSNAELPLPLTVSGNFAPSGYFAGPMVNTAGILQAACENRPAEHTVGECYKFSFQASMLEGTGAYGGVFWQNVANNWGTSPGTKVTAGATKVKFKAWGAAGGESVTFNAGGISGGLCTDGVNLGSGTPQTLTTTPTEYEVSLAGQSYPNGIIGGFVWSTAVTSVEEMVVFYVDEIQWVQ